VDQEVDDGSTTVVMLPVDALVSATLAGWAYVRDET
jgi:hypothetical protein